jgi:ATP-binding cassette, subfamily F, member 3
MINAHNLCLSFGEQPIFKNVSFTCNPTDRIGLVGRNGSGKSTLLKAIGGKQALDDGAIAIAKGANICYLPQEVVLQSTKSIIDETYTAFEFVARLQEKKETLEKLLEEQGDNVGILEEYAHVCGELYEHDLDALQAEAKKVLMGLGFKESQLDEPVASLSGGWKMRVVLAKLLLQKADFYLFDEPTNHLDIVAQEWFLQFLKTAPFGFMIVCHDRYFLNELCTLIFELDPALYYALGTGEKSSAKMYAGNYTTYEIQKEHDLALLESAFKTQQKDIKQKMETIDRFRASASKGKMAQSMLKAVEKIERIEMPPKPSSIHFTFPPIVQPGRLVLTVHHVAQTFGAKQIFHNVNFEVERGKKVALIAPNGVGKTTLFNIITGKLPVQTGSVELGHNVKAVVFDQDQTAALKLDKTMLENLYEAHQTIHEQKIRAFAGSFLFGSDDLAKKVKVLSGGEKNRVGMIKVLLQQANVLLLDEPTNHLDIPSKDILLRALQTYQGTIIFVSHDHDFVAKLATDIIELSADGASLYPGNYELYLYRKRQMESEQNPVKQKSERPGKKQKSEPAAGRTDAAALERTIGKLEKDIVRIEQNFAQLTYGTPEFTQAQQKLQEATQKHAQAVAQWEALTE